MRPTMLTGVDVHHATVAAHAELQPVVYEIEVRQ